MPLLPCTSFLPPYGTPRISFFSSAAPFSCCYLSVSLTYSVIIWSIVSTSCILTDKMNTLMVEQDSPVAITDPESEMVAQFTCRFVFTRLIEPMVGRGYFSKDWVEAVGVRGTLARSCFSIFSLKIESSLGMGNCGSEMIV